MAWTAGGEGKEVDPGPDRRIDVTVVDVYEEHRQRRRRLGRVSRVPSSCRNRRRLEDRQRAMALDVAPVREQTRARYPDDSGYVERDGVRVFYEVYGIGGADVPAAADLVDHPLAAVEGADPVPGARAPRRHVRRAGQRPLRPAVGVRGLRRAGVRARTRSRCWTRPRPTRAVIVGYSLGAPRGLILAAEQPERVAGAVFIGPAYSGGGEPLPSALDAVGGRARHRRGLGEVQQALLAARLPRLRRVLLREDASGSRTRRSRSRTASAGGSRRAPETLIAAHYGANAGAGGGAGARAARALPGAGRSTAIDDAIASHTRGARSPSTQAASSSCSKAAGTLRTRGIPSCSICSARVRGRLA